MWRGLAASTASGASEGPSGAASAGSSSGVSIVLDHDLLALEQIGIATAAMGAGLAVLDCRIVAAARLAMRHGLDGLHG